MMDNPNKPYVMGRRMHDQAYQLSAVAANKKEPPENQLVLCAQTVLSWVREKLQEFQLPEAFQLPEPEQNQNVTLQDLKSGSINEGYSAEIICIPEEKLWTFRLIEPDLTTWQKDGTAVCTAVPGRMFETNLSFRVLGGRLLCGVSVAISEPEHTTSPAFVLCPAVVYQLAQHPKIGLSAGRPLEKRIWELNSKQAHKQLRDSLKTWPFPAVVFCDYTKPVQKILPTPGAVLSEITSHLSTASPLRHTFKQELPAENQNHTPQIPYPAETFSEKRWTYTHCFHLPADQFQAFEAVQKIPVHNGEILLLKPEAWGGGLVRYPYLANEIEDTFQSLLRDSQECWRNQTPSFKDLIFLDDAKALLLQQYRRSVTKEASLRQTHQEAIEQLCEAHQAEMAQKEETLQQQAEKITRLKALLRQADEEKETFRKMTEESANMARQGVERMADQLEYYKSILSRPKTPQDLPEWAKQRFEGRLMLHERAERLIRAVPPNSIDMNLLCDALEYLAGEYRELVSGKLKQEAVFQRCADKYGRPFEVAQNGETNIARYASKYKVKYQRGYKGKPVETPMDKHLRVGNTGGNLIRIYFFYDSEQDRIVVGSLPEHLPVAQIQS